MKIRGLLRIIFVTSSLLLKYVSEFQLSALCQERGLPRILKSRREAMYLIR